MTNYENNLKVAILGATSHIAKGLIKKFLKSDDCFLYLFSRSPDKLKNFIGFSNRLLNKPLHDFGNHSYHVILNCIGFGTPDKIKQAASDIFFITEKYDNIIIDYLKTNENCLYINFSSGAVYGKNFESPADPGTKYILDIAQISSNDYYSIAKIHSEAKHRSLTGYNIADLRVFSYFSEFIDMDSSYLLIDILRSIINKTEFLTTPVNIARDYIHPDDLFQLVRCLIKYKKSSLQPVNDVFDVYSRKFVTKNEIIAYFTQNYNLKCVRDQDAGVINATGIKDHYYSVNKKARLIEYEPVYSSIETIKEESKKILENYKTDFKTWTENPG